MPDQPVSSTSPQHPSVPDELNLVEPTSDKPRIKRRNLKTRSDSSSDPLPDSPRAEHPPTETPSPAASSSPSPASSSTPVSSYSLPSTPLYYTTGVPKAKEDAPTMKTNPVPSSSAASSASTRPSTASPTPATSSSPQSRPATTAATPTSSYQARPAVSASSTSSSASPRPAVSASSIPSGAFSAATGASARPAASAASATSSSSTAARPASSTISAPSRASSSSVNDFRSNAERQAREQKSISGLISIIVYVLVGLFVLGTILAGYGAYVISRQIHQQSITLSDLDSRYTARTQALATQLQTTNDALARSNAQIAREQELIALQQENLTKLANAAEANTAAWRVERQSRAAETASLRARVRDLEDQPHFGPSANH
jgi:hypothetical protein